MSGRDNDEGTNDVASWTNDEGEPIMDGAAYRFEQQLDAETVWDYDEPDYYDEPVDLTDAEADDDALVVAGWGMDEDYGYFGDPSFED